MDHNVSFKNNGKLKLLIIVGTRPEIIRLAAVIKKCRKYFDCLLAHTRQNYDYNLMSYPINQYQYTYIENPTSILSECLTTYAYCSVQCVEIQCFLELHLIS